MSFTTDLAEGYAQLLAAASLGVTWRPDGQYQPGETPIHVGAMPPDPDVVVVLMPYPLSDDPVYSESLIGMQIRTRGPRGDLHTPTGLDDAISGHLLGLWPLDLPNGIRITVLERTSSAPLGQDATDRWLWVSNYTNTLYRPTTHRH